MRTLNILALVALLSAGCATHRTWVPSISEAPRDSLELEAPLRIALLDARARKEKSEEVVESLRSDLSAIYGDALRWVPYFEETPPGEVTLRVRVMACGAEFGSRIAAAIATGTKSGSFTGTASGPWGPVVATGTSQQTLLAGGISGEGWWTGTAWLEMQIEDRRFSEHERIAFPLIAEERRPNAWGYRTADRAAERAWAKVGQGLVAVLDEVLVTLRDAEAS